MTLLDLKTGDLFVITGKNRWPPAHIEPPAGTIYRFGHLDGMYSYCQIVDGEYSGEIVHPVAWAEVERVNEGLQPVGA